MHEKVIKNNFSLSEFDTIYHDITGRHTHNNSI